MKFATRISAAIVLGCACALIGAVANAVDLRDWGRKYNSASERYVVLAAFNNEAVLDKETQLVWRRAPGVATSLTLATQACLTTIGGGRLGWRLPSLSELASLVGTDAKLPIGHPFQNLGAQDAYWSSTAFPSNLLTFTYAKQLLSPSFVLKYTASDVSPYLCVRGVGAADR